jgi:hypothetical protein
MQFTMQLNQRRIMSSGNGLMTTPEENAQRARGISAESSGKSMEDNNGTTEESQSTEGSNNKGRRGSRLHDFDDVDDDEYDDDCEDGFSEEEAEATMSMMMMGDDFWCSAEDDDWWGERDGDGDAYCSVVRRKLSRAECRRRSQEVTFYRPDGNTESKSIQWCIENNFEEIEPWLVVGSVVLRRARTVRSSQTQGNAA